jgi:phospholipase/carboxylesterase
MEFAEIETVDCAAINGLLGVLVTYVQCHVCASVAVIVPIVTTIITAKMCAHAAAIDRRWCRFMRGSFPQLPRFASRFAGRRMIAVWRRPRRDGAHTPVVVVLHGRGADEHDLLPMIERLPATFAYVSVRAFVDVEGGGFTWFENRGIARPIASSVRDSVVKLRGWIDEIVSPTGRKPCYLLGFSAGMMMAGALLLDDPLRYAGAVLLSGALAFDAGIATEPGRLSGVPVFYGRGSLDDVIPAPLVAQSEVFLRDRSGADLTVRDYPHAHTISPGEIRDIAAWLSEHR